MKLVAYLLGVMFKEKVKFSNLMESSVAFYGGMRSKNLQSITNLLTIDNVE